jgi:hypothetical protein
MKNSLSTVPGGEACCGAERSSAHCIRAKRVKRNGEANLSCTDAFQISETAADGHFINRDSVGDDRPPSVEIIAS